MATIPMPSMPSPLPSNSNGLQAMKLQHAGLSDVLHQMTETMGQSPHANTPIGKAFMSFMQQMPNMLQNMTHALGANFSASGGTFQLGGNNLTTGLANTVQGFMKNLPQAEGTFLNVFSSTTAASLSNKFLNAISGDDRSNSQQAVSNRTQQQAVPSGTTPKSPRPEGMG